jgi:hypothetical protein
LVNDHSQKIPKLPEDLKQNVNWNQTLLNEVKVRLMPSISFLSMDVEHVDCHSSACLTPKKKRLKKIAQLGRECRVQCILWKIMIFFQFFHTNLWIFFFQTLNHNQGRVITPAFPKTWKLWSISILMNQFPRSPHVTLWGLCTSTYVSRSPVFDMRTYIVRILNLSTLSEVRISNFE